MGVAVLDASVLIRFLNQQHPHHESGLEAMHRVLASGDRRWLCAVTYSEILVGPLAAGSHTVVEHTVDRLNIDIIDVDTRLAKRAAMIRARTRLKLPDAFVLATAVQAERSGHEEVRLVSFDERLLRVREELP